MKKKSGIWNFLRLYDEKLKLEVFKIERVSFMLEHLFLSDVNANLIEVIKNSTLKENKW